MHSGTAGILLATTILLLTTGHATAETIDFQKEDASKSQQVRDHLACGMSKTYSIESSILKAFKKCMRAKGYRDISADRERAKRSQIEHAQYLLNRLGYEPGPADGKLGKKTLQAIRKFETDNGFSRSQGVTTELLKKLGKASPAKLSRIETAEISKTPAADQESSSTAGKHDGSTNTESLIKNETVIDGKQPIISPTPNSSVLLSERRVALVIGNSSYKLISPLANPKNDAILMAATLKDVGFEVVTAIDVDYRDMRQAVRKFGKALRNSGSDAVGLLYYAGHGIQAKGQNFLIPLGAQIESTADLSLEALSASDILAQMEDAGNRLNLVILDACRNNPFPGKVRAAGRGLARIQAASGSLIAFAAAPGQVASDGNGSNSPYTSALVKAMKQPGIAVEQVFKRARVGVERVTGGRQTPWEESSLTGDFYFVPGGSSVQSNQTPKVHPNNETLFWSSIKDSDDVSDFEAYLRRFPDGTFSELARNRIKRLEEAKAVVSEGIQSG